MKSYIKIIFGFFLAILNSCGSYEIENNQWAWVSYDEGVGKRVRYVKGADFTTFEVLKENSEYAKDKNHVYLKTSIIKGADPNSFKPLKKGYSKDKNFVYLDDIRVVFAKPLTFKILKWPYSKDENHVFCGTIPIPTKYPREFRVVKSGEGKMTSIKSSFIEENPSYSWLDSVDVDGVITSTFDGKGKTSKEVFESFDKVE